MSGNQGGPGGVQRPGTQGDISDLLRRVQALERHKPISDQGAELPWCRWRLLEEKVIDSTFFEADGAYEVINPYPEIFETIEVGLRRTRPIIDGVYAMNYRIFWSSGVCPPHGVTLVGIDPDFWESYAITPGPIDTGIMAETGPAGSYITRMQGGEAGGVLPVVRFFAAPYEHEAWIGTFFEIIRLGNATSDKLWGGADD